MIMENKEIFCKIFEYGKYSIKEVVNPFGRLYFVHREDDAGYLNWLGTFPNVDYAERFIIDIVQAK